MMRAAETVRAAASLSPARPGRTHLTRTPRRGPTMRILLTNDDGIYAPGLLAMRDALSALGEVIVGQES